MPTINQLRVLSRLRLKEAQYLYNQQMYDGACYLGGYAIELAFKAKICKLLKVSDYPEKLQSFKIHRLEELVFLAGLKSEWESKKISNSLFKTNCDLVFAWNETWRYLPKGTKTQMNAQDFLEAITNNTDGVFTWIKNKW